MIQLLNGKKYRSTRKTCSFEFLYFLDSMKVIVAIDGERSIVLGTTARKEFAEDMALEFVTDFGLYEDKKIPGLPIINRDYYKKGEYLLAYAKMKIFKNKPKTPGLFFYIVSLEDRPDLNIEKGDVRIVNNTDGRILGAACWKPIGMYLKYEVYSNVGVAAKRSKNLVEKEI